MKSRNNFQPSYLVLSLFIIVLSNPKSGTMLWKWLFSINFSICCRSILFMYFDSILFCTCFSTILFVLLLLYINICPLNFLTTSSALASSFYMLLFSLIALCLTSKTFLTGIVSNFSRFLRMVSYLCASRSLSQPVCFVLKSFGSNDSSSSWTYFTLFMKWFIPDGARLKGVNKSIYLLIELPDLVPSFCALLFLRESASWNLLELRLLIFPPLAFGNSLTSSVSSTESSDLLCLLSYMGESHSFNVIIVLLI